jgi:ubiquinone/menaquinone biosynthesis C-methylase UbiE
MQIWERIFKRKGKYFVEPHVDMEEVIKIFHKHKVKKILDIGCGTGRHLIYLARHGFEVYGLDSAKTAIESAKNWLEEEGLKGHLKIANQYDKLPYEDSFFDAVISTQALHHGRTAEVKKVIAEIERVLKPKGCIFITVARKFTEEEIKSLPYDLPKSEEIEENVFVPLEGQEKGLPHFLFTEKTVREFFSNFNLLKLHIIGSHYCFIGVKR